MGSCVSRWPGVCKVGRARARVCVCVRGLSSCPFRNRFVLTAGRRREEQQNMGTANWNRASAGGSLGVGTFVPSAYVPRYLFLSPKQIGSRELAQIGTCSLGPRSAGPRPFASYAKQCYCSDLSCFSTVSSPFLVFFSFVHEWSHVI